MDQWVMRVSPVIFDPLWDRAIYLESYDPEAGSLGIVTTTDLARAKRFPSLQAVLECWKTQSRTVPLRTDGKPNRPLTAFTIEPAKLE